MAASEKPRQALRTLASTAALLWQSSLQRIRLAVAGWCEPRSAGSALAIGLLAAALALGLRAMLRPLTGESDMLISLFPMLLMASLTGGARAGSFCLLLGTVLEWYLYMGEPRSFRLAGNEPGVLAGSTLVGILVIAIAEGLRVAVRRLGESRSDAQLLAREMEHRVKNTLTLVTVLSRHTFRSDRSLELSRDEFEARIGALAGAHGAILETPLHGADLESLVTTTLLPFGFAAGSGRFAVHGPALRLPPRVAVSFALALHELATNAAKHGALRAAEGRIAITWRLSEAAPPTFHFTWAEAGGPLGGSPRGDGFGMHLIERNLPRAVNGSASLRLEGPGLRFELEAPFHNVCGTG